MGRKRKGALSVTFTLVALTAAIIVGYAKRDSLFAAFNDLKDRITYGIKKEDTIEDIYIDPAVIPEYTGEAYVYINENKPVLNMSDGDKKFERYAPTDSYGRCVAAYVNVSPETMPDTERESIGNVRPTGWHLIKYDGIDGNYLYNRCHLIAFMLSGENANERNLITGTRYMNTQGMLPFEIKVSDYIKRTGNHVLYKVVPVYTEDDLLARGVWMQGASVEDDEIRFNVFCYNVQPGIYIDYSDGSSREAG